MSSYSGLSAEHCGEVRRLLVKGAHNMLTHAAQIHYTQGPLRWQGFDKGLHIVQGEFPTEVDCSSCASWLVGDALRHVHPGIADIINGEHWRGGFTGTIAKHGRRVVHDGNIKVGDLILFGRAPKYEHVAVALGGAVIFSMGSENGPYRLGLDYRPDRGPTLRFI